MFRQTDIAILCPIRQERLETLRNTLQQLAAQVTAGETTLFDQLIEHHFVRWVILEAATGVEGDSYAPQLLFSSNIDGNKWDYLYGLLSIDPQLLITIYSCCDGFPEVSAELDAAQSRLILAYWGHHLVESGAYFVGAVGIACHRIKREALLVTRLQQEIDRQIRLGRWRETSPELIRLELQQYVRAQADLHWALLPESCGRWREGLLYFSKIGLKLLLVILVILPLWLPLLALVGIWLMMLRQQERVDQVVDIANWQSHYEHIARIAVEEDNVQQNPMTSVTEIKPGWLRAVTLRTVLGVINFAAETLFTRGKLGGIGTIHFARWNIIDGGRRLLFLSNYDGSWERYLGDFIDRAASGLTAVWSNTRGFPRTKGLIFGGARHAQAFKAYARASQLPTQVWYTAYRRLSIANVLRNERIREGLRGEMDRTQAEAWLKQF